MVKHKSSNGNGGNGTCGVAGYHYGAVAICQTCYEGMLDSIAHAYYCVTHMADAARAAVERCATTAQVDISKRLLQVLEASAGALTAIEAVVRLGKFSTFDGLKSPVTCAMGKECIDAAITDDDKVMVGIPLGTLAPEGITAVKRLLDDSDPTIAKIAREIFVPYYGIERDIAAENN